MPTLARSLGVVLLILTATAADWPQYRGPQRNDVSAEKGLLPQWPAEGPPLLGKYTNAGVGYSGPAIVGTRLYTLGGRGEREFLIALDLAGIKEGVIPEAWSVEVGPLFDFKTNRWSAGPSATPTVDDGLVFAVGGMGDLVCVTAADGKEKWRINQPNELDAQINPIGGGPRNLGWGFTSSPLVDGDRLVCIVGGPKGTVAALEKQTGKVVWRSVGLTDQAAYTSPMVAELGGVRQYVVLTNRGLYGIRAEDGEVLWRHARTPPYGTEVVNTPILQGDLIFTTVGARQGCELVRVRRDGDKFSPEKVYGNASLANHHGDVVLVDGHVYGFGEGQGWACQNLESGDIVWSERRALRAGAVTYADGRLYCYGEDDGTVVLVPAVTSGWKEQGRFKIPEQSKLRKPNGKIWTPPVVANGKLFLRDQDLIFCYDVKAQP